MKLTDINFKHVQLEGLHAFFEGQELDACPYRPDSLAESHWIMG